MLTLRAATIDDLPSITDIHMRPFDGVRHSLFRQRRALPCGGTLHGKKGRDFKVWSVDYARILLRGDQERLLREAGFGSGEFCGSFRLEPYDKEYSAMLTAVAHK